MASMTAVSTPAPLLSTRTDTRTRVLRSAPGDAEPWELWERPPRPSMRGLVAGLWAATKGRHLTGFHLDREFPDLVIRPIVEENGGIWSDDEPVVIDDNLVSSRHPNDIEHFTGGIRQWLEKHIRER